MQIRKHNFSESVVEPGPLLLSNSNNTFLTYKIVNRNESKSGLSFTRSDPELDGTYESITYIRTINSAKRSQIFCDPDADRSSKLMTDG
jgi:hypothetical protein